MAALVLAVAGGGLALAAAIRSGGSAAPDVRAMSLVEARPVLDALSARVPPPLRGTPDDAAWHAWTAAHALDVRARLDRADEDSVVNLLLYGTTFTRQPRAVPDGLHADISALLDGRLDDLLTALQSADTDERLQFARGVLARHQIQPAAREDARRYLASIRSRLFAENARYVQRFQDASTETPAEQREAEATLYQDRGLSSDTSLRVDFALDRAMAALRDQGEFAHASLDRLAVVGPGLDVIDKAQGYDLFPVQTIQPFALVDSIRRLKIGDHPVVTALEINPRVRAHVDRIRERAANQAAYRLHLPLERDRPGVEIDPGLVDYWMRFGDAIGAAGTADVPAPWASDLRVRTVDVRPGVVLDVTARDLDVVVQRIDLPASQRFDAIVATNVLVYYDAFAQGLAADNMASLLRPGGLLLTNQPLPLPGTSGLSSVLVLSVTFDRVQVATGTHPRGDTVYVYRKESR